MRQSFLSAANAAIGISKLRGTSLDQTTEKESKTAAALAQAPAEQVLILVSFVVQGSTSLTFYLKLLRAQIPKAQKDKGELTVFFTLLGSALCKMLVKSTPSRLNRSKHQ